MAGQVAGFASGRWNNLCARPLWEDTGQGVDPDSVTMVQAVTAGPAAFVGRLVAVEPGWGPYGGVAEAGYLRVEEVLVNRAAHAAPSVGDIVSILFPGGGVTIRGIRICQDRTEGFYAPIVGDRVLAIGRRSRNDSVLFRDVYRFPIMDDEVLAQPYRNLRSDQRSVALQLLENELMAFPNEGKDNR